MKGLNINKSFMDKSEAEKQYGFVLYQGGVVPGNNLRVVQIQDTDVEACCGTHHDKTSDVGWVKILKSTRIQDGIVRLYYVAVKIILKIVWKGIIRIKYWKTNYRRPLFGLGNRKG